VIKEAGSQEIDFKALESSSDPLEKLNFTQENMLLLPILDDILGEGENRNTKGYILIIGAGAVKCFIPDKDLAVVKQN